jgi:hypothetical protein
VSTRIQYHTPPTKLSIQDGILHIGLYLTHQLRIAIHYASLITNACPAADQRTVEIHVPLFHFQPVKMWELEFEDEDYKMLLYCSRRDERYPKELSKKLAVHGVVHGLIGHCHNKAFGKMDAYTQITPEHQLHDKPVLDWNRKT